MHTYAQLYGISWKFFQTAQEENQIIHQPSQLQINFHMLTLKYYFYLGVNYIQNICTSNQKNHSMWHMKHLLILNPVWFKGHSFDCLQDSGNKITGNSLQATDLNMARQERSAFVVFPSPNQDELEASCDFIAHKQSKALF